MNLTEEELTLAVAARNRERGALRAFAVSLDERLGETDIPLDGAVAAWCAVAVRPAPSWRTLTATLSGWLGKVRRPKAGVERFAGRAPGRPKQSTSERTVLDRRPAA